MHFQPPLVPLEEVSNLSDLLRRSCYEPAKRELAAIKAFAKEHGYDGELAPWDVSFWSERQKEERYAFRVGWCQYHLCYLSPLD